MAQNKSDQEQNKPSGVDSTLTRHGGLSYLEIPAIDARRSAEFYEKVLGWEIGERDDGTFRFEDRTVHLIGRWKVGSAITREPGWVPYFYVDGVDDAVALAGMHGGQIAEPPFWEGDLWIAKVRDPAGNLIGLWQAGPRG